MARRLRLTLIMAFFLAHLGIVNGTSASFAHMDMMKNCSVVADGCCDAIGLHDCTSCAPCAGYISGPSRSLERNDVQIHEVIAPEILYPIVSSIDPPPPRN